MHNHQKLWVLIVKVLRVGDAWLVGVGKRAPHGFRRVYYLSVGSLARLKGYTSML